MMETLQLARFNRSTRHQDSEPCRNCSTDYIGNFCPQCGQEAHTGAPTAWGFVYEFFTRNVFERGKLPRTLWRLVRHPGGLTVDFLEGRRQRYIRPVRLYFGLSVLYFLLLSLQSGSIVKNFGGEQRPLVAKSPSASVIGATNAPVAIHAAKPIKKTPPIADNGKNAGVGAGDTASDFNLNLDSDSDFVTNLPDTGFAGELKRRFTRFGKIPQQERMQVVSQGMLNQAPKAMFFLVPIFALLLKMLFLLRKIPYGAHLLFAFHYHALLFLGLLVLFLPLPDSMRIAVWCMMWLYLPLALHATYACSWRGALWRLLVMNVLYAIAIMLALMGSLAAALLL